MDITERLRVLLIALMEDVRGDSCLMTPYTLELTITSSPVWPSMLSTTLSFKLDSLTQEDLSSILQNLRASNAGTSSSTQE